MLLDLAALGTVVITVDDSGHADTESVRCLLHLARRLDTATVVVVLSDETDPPSNSPLRAELLRQPHADRLSVGPLSPGGVAQVLTDRTGTPPTDRLCAEFLAATGGNPLLVHALIDDHVTAGAARQQGYGLALVSSLHRAGPAPVAVARALAVLGADGSPDRPALLGRMAGIDTETVTGVLHALTSAGLIGEQGLRHPVARTALLDDLTRPERVEAHLLAAAVLHEQGAPAVRIAEQLARAGRADQPWASAVLLEAAEQAMIEGRPAAAATFLTVARDHTTDRRSLPVVLTKLTEAQWQLSPSAAAGHLDRLTELAGDSELGQAEQVTLVRQLLWHGRDAEAGSLIERVRAEAGGSPRSAAELRAFELWLACAHPSLAAPRKPLAAAGDPVLDSTVTGTDPWLRAAAELADVLIRGRQQEAHQSAADVLRGLRYGRRTAWAEESALLAVLVLIGAGRLADAGQWCDQFSSDTDPTEAPTWPALFAAGGADIALRLGDFAGAADKAQTALTELSQQSWGVAIGYPLASLIMATTRMGDYEDAAKHLTHAAPSITDALLHSRYGLPYLHARGHYYLATNHAHAALADFLSCGELVREWALDLAELVPWRIGAAEAWLRLGNPDQAKVLLYEQLGRPGMAGSRIRGLALRLLAATRPVARAPEMLTEALELLEACGDRYEQARVLADLSKVHTELGDERKARMVFRRAWHVAELCGARPLCAELLAANGEARVTAASAPTTADFPEFSTLTSSERRVASLAVMGCTNREIAEKLHITASTVEQHLTRVYRKLNVKRRRDLPADLRIGTTPARAARA